eukprot:g15152.t1
MEPCLPLVFPSAPTELEDVRVLLAAPQKTLSTDCSFVCLTAAGKAFFFVEEGPRLQSVCVLPHRLWGPGKGQESIRTGSNQGAPTAPLSIEHELLARTVGAFIEGFVAADWAEADDGVLVLVLVTRTALRRIDPLDGRVVSFARVSWPHSVDVGPPYPGHAANEIECAALLRNGKQLAVGCVQSKNVFGIADLDSGRVQNVITIGRDVGCVSQIVGRKDADLFGVLTDKQYVLYFGRNERSVSPERNRKGQLLSGAAVTASSRGSAATVIAPDAKIGVVFQTQVEGATALLEGVDYHLCLAHKRVVVWDAGFRPWKDLFSPKGEKWLGVQSVVHGDSSREGNLLFPNSSGTASGFSSRGPQTLRRSASCLGIPERVSSERSDFLVAWTVSETLLYQIDIRKFRLQVGDSLPRLPRWTHFEDDGEGEGEMEVGEVKVDEADSASVQGDGGIKPVRRSSPAVSPTNPDGDERSGTAARSVNLSKVAKLPSKISEMVDLASSTGGPQLLEDEGGFSRSPPFVRPLVWRFSNGGKILSALCATRDRVREIEIADRRVGPSVIADGAGQPQMKTRSVSLSLTDAFSTGERAWSFTMRSAHTMRREVPIFVRSKMLPCGSVNTVVLYYLQVRRLSLLARADVYGLK